LQIIHIHWRQVFRCPLQGFRRQGIKVYQVDFPDGADVVIAGDAYSVEFLQEADALARFRAVADDIPEAPDFVNLPLLADVVQYGLQRRQVAVYVRQNCATHCSINITVFGMVSGVGQVSASMTVTLAY